jgi:ribosomal protein L15
MKLEALSSVPGARKRGIRVGRGPGSGLGKTSGRGHKGQYARSGHKHKPGFEGGQMRLVRRLPKVGFKSPRSKVLAPVNVSRLDQFSDGSMVDEKVLRDAGVVKGRWDGIKILGGGDLHRKLTIHAHAFSGEAKSKIEVAGGVCELIVRTPAKA